MLVARKALEGLLAGDLVVEVCTTVEAHSPKSELPQWDRATECALLSESFVWYDYCSIPQVHVDVPHPEDIGCGAAVGVQDHRRSTRNGHVVKDMVDAVSSIPVYVGLSDLFLVLAPPSTRSL